MLHIHRCASAQMLVGGLADLLATPSGDVFATEIVAVPAKGVERWLAQRLSHVLGAGPEGAGICANVRFPSPEALLDTALARCTPGSTAQADPWDPNRAVWPLLELVESAGGRLAGRSAEGGRGYPVAARLAEIFARYGRERPAMLRRWAAGEDLSDDGEALPADLSWQPDLWRGLRAAIGRPSPAESLPSALEQLLARPELVDLPDRFSIFGLNRLAASRLAVLNALARGREVHLWINHPSGALWDAVAAGGSATHPLLASMARDVISLQRRLGSGVGEATHHLHPSPARPTTLLGRLQDALAADRVPVPPQRPRLDPADASVVVHSCHGSARQVEVLREAILERLAADPTLQPRDVLVMCPDIEEFAPLLSAAFGGAAAHGSSAVHPAAGLRVRLADRSPRATNPLLATATTILRLAASRVGTGEVLDLAATDTVRRRFGFDSDDTARLREWVGQARICWGLDAPHRARWGLGGVAAGTWRDGLDRLLLGVCMEAEAGWLGEAAPCDVDSADIDLLGRFAEFVDRLSGALRACTGDRPVGEWARLLGRLVLSVAAPTQDWQEGALLAELAEWADTAACHEVSIGLPDVTDIWLRRSAGRPSRAGFRTGTLTVCTMVPMRSVPHRVIALLGLDDGVFPRSGVTDGDDLLARAPRPGERDPRSEDRQLLLDAVLAAGEHLLIVCTGADERTGLPVPPAVPLAELLDALDQVAQAPEGKRVRDQVTLRHPLQAFDPRNFGVPAQDDDGVGIRRPVSFDVSALAGARALLRPRSCAAGIVGEALPPAPLDEVELDDLRALLTHPARGFLAQRLGVRLSGDDDEPPDELPVTLDPLTEWSVGERFLAARLRRRSVNACLEMERRRGTLPPGALGHVAAQRIGRTAEAICVAALTHLEPEPRTIDVSLTMGATPRPVTGAAPRSVVGTVAGVHGTELVRVSYSSLGAKQLLSAWLDLLATTIAFPDVDWRAVVIGRDRRDSVRRTIGPVRAGPATDALADLIALADEGLREPLPIPVRTAYAYAGAAHRGLNHENALRTAASKWRNKYGGEASEPANVLIWGADAELSTLGETRLATLATRLWDPILVAGAGGGR